MRWLSAVVVVGCAGAARPPVIAQHVAPPPPEPPRAHRVVVTDTEIEILPERWFATGVELAADAPRALDAVAHVLDADPEIGVMQVEAFGGTGVGIDPLGERRAQLIVRELVLRHVDPRRLVARGSPGVGSGVVFTILAGAP